MMLLAFYKQGDIYISEPALDLRWWIIPPLVEGEQWEVKKVFESGYQQSEGFFNSYSDAREWASRWAWSDHRGRGINNAGKFREIKKGRNLTNSITTELNEKGEIYLNDLFLLMVGKWGFEISKSHFMKVIKQLCGRSHFRKVARRRVEADIYRDSELGMLTVDYSAFGSSLQVDGFNWMNTYPKSKKMRIDYAIDVLLNNEGASGQNPYNTLRAVDFGEWTHYKDVHYKSVPFYIISSFGQVPGSDLLPDNDGVWPTGWRRGAYLHNIIHNNPDMQHLLLHKWRVMRKLYDDLIHLHVPGENFIRYRIEWLGEKAYLSFGYYREVFRGERLEYDRATNKVKLSESWKNRNTEKAEQLKNDVSFEGVPSE